MRKTLVAIAAGLVVALLAQAAFAAFAPKFTVALSDTKVKGNPEMKFHLEFTADDEEIGLFTSTLPKGFVVATDEQIPQVNGPTGSEKGEVIGGGNITIHGGVDCRPGPEGAIPLGTDVDIAATFYERTRTDEEADSGVVAVWFLDIEPLNRVRLLVKGSPTTGYTVSGAPTPSDNTCNPLVVDLTINAKSESGVPIVTNPAKKGKYLLTADIASQDSPTVAHFENVVKITK
jgi:hypothetical protein